MASTSSLYGEPRPKASGPTSATPSSLAFSSTLSSLLSQPANTTAGRVRPSKSKADLFSVHNRGSKKRALADISSDGPPLQKHNADIEAVDAASLQHSKRKMEEKARLYASMKRGDYVPPTSRGGRVGVNKEENGLVDFDRKWAEDQEAGRDANSDPSSDDGRGDGDTDAVEELVEYEDDMGRTRKGTKAEAERERRRRNAKVHAEEELSKYSARPSRPDNIVYGDTIQSAAFNPDDALAEKMQNIAKKRDRSMTPPEEVHYDASKEVRSKGVGFYAFSQDKEGRQKEMEGLERERGETERMKKEREERKEAKKRQIEERRREIGKKREKNLADAFLRGMEQ